MSKYHYTFHKLKLNQQKPLGTGISCKPEVSPMIVARLDRKQQIWQDWYALLINWSNDPWLPTVVTCYRHNGLLPEGPPAIRIATQTAMPWATNTVSKSPACLRLNVAWAIAPKLRNWNIPYRKWTLLLWHPKLLSLTTSTKVPRNSERASLTRSSFTENRSFSLSLSIVKGLSK